MKRSHDKGKEPESPRRHSYNELNPRFDAALAAEIHKGTALQRVDFGRLHDRFPRIFARRAKNQHGYEFADHVVDTRRSIHRLNEGSTGSALLTQLDRRMEEIGGIGIDIYSGSATARGRSVLEAVGEMSARPKGKGAYRYDGAPGEGAGSTIRYDGGEPSGLRFISLGHELIHAWRAAHGIMVGGLDAHPEALSSGNKYEIQPINEHAVLTEEFETVGLLPQPYGAPSENDLRRENNAPLRNTYGGNHPDDGSLSVSLFSHKQRRALRLLEDLRPIAERRPPSFVPRGIPMRLRPRSTYNDEDPRIG